MIVGLWNLGQAAHMDETLQDQLVSLAATNQTTHEKIAATLASVGKVLDALSAQVDALADDVQEIRGAFPDKWA